MPRAPKLPAQSSRLRSAPRRPLPPDLPVALVPSSWPLGEWSQRAPLVWPNTTQAARWMWRMNYPALINAGAACRVGKTIVILGLGYVKWLQANAVNVPNFEVPANQQRREAKAKEAARAAARQAARKEARVSEAPAARQEGP